MWFVPLAIVYYVVVTPIGLIKRLVHDPLARRISPGAESYWRIPHC